MYVSWIPKSFISGLLLAILITPILTQTTSAVSVGVSPHSLQFDLKDGVLQKNITVINNGNDFSSYMVYTDSEYSSQIIISSSRFDLSPGMTKEVTVSCIPSDSASGNISLKINVAASSDGTDLGIGAGIRIPVTIVTGNSVDQSGIHVYTSFSQHMMNYF